MVNFIFCAVHGFLEHFVSQKYTYCPAYSDLRLDFATATPTAITMITNSS